MKAIEATFPALNWKKKAKHCSCSFYLLLTYKGNFVFSVFLNGLKNQRVSEGPSGLK